MMLADELIEKIVNRAHTPKSENDVKRIVRRVLDYLGAFHFMPPANVYAKAGISDIIVMYDGHGIAIETKYGSNKLTTNQRIFGEKWSQQGGLFLVVRDTNIITSMRAVVSYANGTSIPLYNE